MPICDSCGSYFVRPPCPLCSEGIEEQPGITKDSETPTKKLEKPERGIRGGSSVLAKEEVDRLRRLNESHQNHIAELERKLEASKRDSFEPQIAQIQAQTTEKDREIADLAVQVEDRGKTIQDLEAKLVDQSQTISEFEGVRSRAGATSKELTATKAKIADNSRLQTELEEKIRGLETRTQDQERMIQQQKQQLTAFTHGTLDAQIAQMQKETAEKERKNTNLAFQVANQQKMIQSLKNKLASKEQGISEHEGGHSEAETFRKELTAAKAEIADKERLQTELEEKVRRLETRIQEKERVIQQQTQHGTVVAAGTPEPQLTPLQKETEDEETEISNLTSQVLNQEKMIQALETELADKNKGINEFKGVRSWAESVRKELTDAIDAIEELKAKIQALDRNERKTSNL
ncbi:MAG: hypothetical protein ACE5OZ_06660 [Candidatus Heimdallarchaeota archaeon]